MSGYRPPYTTEEERKILRYICDKKKFYNLRGNEMWQQMVADGVIQRTWQSVKEHFRKKIIPKLNDPRLGLTKEEITAIRQGYDLTSMTQHSKTQEKEQSQDPPSTSHGTCIDLTDIVDLSDEEL